MLNVNVKYLKACLTIRHCCLLLFLATPLGVASYCMDYRRSGYAGASDGEATFEGHIFNSLLMYGCRKILIPPSLILRGVLRALNNISHLFTLLFFPSSIS